MNRVWHPYTIWEDYLAGMWRTLPKTQESIWVEIAITFTGNPLLYGKWMREVIVKWPIACEHNLTSEATNKLAWIGHSACCMATGCPEYITRLAWRELSNDQRDAANLQAEVALWLWNQGYERKPVIDSENTTLTPGFDFKTKIYHWIKKWEGRGYPDGIPDEAPSNLEDRLRVPSYRMICLAIMKNDMTLETLGFARPNCELYNLIKRREIAAR